jgi:hypothetical protein
MPGTLDKLDVSQFRLNADFEELPQHAGEINLSVYERMQAEGGRDISAPYVYQASLPPGCGGICNVVFSMIQMSTDLVNYRATGHYTALQGLNPGPQVTPEKALRAALFHEHAHWFFFMAELEQKVIDLAGEKGVADVDDMEKYANSVSEAFALRTEEALSNLNFNHPNGLTPIHPQLFYKPVVELMYREFRKLTDQGGIRVVVQDLKDIADEHFLMPGKDFPIS